MSGNLDIEGAPNLVAIFRSDEMGHVDGIDLLRDDTVVIDKGLGLQKGVKMSRAAE
jgi:hypothetical protein